MTAKREYKKRDGLRRRGKTWYVVLRQHGKTVWIRTKAKSEREAGQQRDRLRVQRDDGVLIAGARRLTFDDLKKMLLADYTAKENVSKPQLTHLTERFGDWRAQSITTSAVREYEADRLAVGASRSTVNGELAALRRMFRLALEAGHLATMPVIKTPTPDNAREGFFEEKMLKAVLDQLPLWARPVVLFQFFTGWRVGSKEKRGETLLLRWRDNVDWRAQVIRLEPGTTKNKDGREFPFGNYPPLKRLLEAQLASGEAHSSPWVFHRDGQKIPYKLLRTVWKAACAQVPSAKGRIMHDLRRSTVRQLERASVSRSVAMKLTGHKTESVYRRYAIVDAAAQAEGVAKLAKFVTLEQAVA